ncbi:MAG: hypothetical protein KDK70_17295, partial [Myxococcales bacterium]|nr:hypothetical protein [Myxococcales bacterium]
MVGLLVTALLVIVLGSVIPVTPPMAFFWAISIAVATGLAATLLPFHRFFTTEKIKALEQKRDARSPEELQPGG